MISFPTKYEAQMALHFMSSDTVQQRHGWAKLLLVAIGVAAVLVSSIATAQP